MNKSGFLPPSPLRGSLPHRGRKQVDFANEVKRNRYGFPADTKYRGNVSPRRVRILPHWGSAAPAGGGYRFQTLRFSLSILPQGGSGSPKHSAGKIPLHRMGDIKKNLTNRSGFLTFSV